MGRALTADPVDSSPGTCRPSWWCHRADGRGRRSRPAAVAPRWLLSDVPALLGPCPRYVETEVPGWNCHEPDKRARVYESLQMGGCL